MAMLLSILSIVLLIGNIVCWVMEIIAAFKNEEKPILGIVSIIPCLSLGGLVVGWMKHKEWGITQLMMIWSVIFVLGFVVNIISATIAAGAAAGAAGGIPVPGAEF